MTTDHVTDHVTASLTEDLTPEAPNDALRRQLLRFLAAADTAGLQIDSVTAGGRHWFVHGPYRNAWSLEQARSLVTALDARIVDISVPSDSRSDFLNVLLPEQTALSILIEKQVTTPDCQAAALTLARLAEWETPLAWMDPTAVRDAYRAARHRVTTPADLIALGAAAQTLGIHDDTH